METTERYFERFSTQTIGQDASIVTPYGRRPLIYADWAASGRLYRPIEERMLNTFGPLVANTHTESNATGEFMTHAYHEAKSVIKAHVGANDTDVLLATGSGMTSAVTLLQRLLGWRLPERYQGQVTIEDEDRPIVFVSGMEHHSNHTTWIETIADVVVVPSTRTEPIDLEALRQLLQTYASRRTKVAAITAASNVTGVLLPVHDVAEIMHDHHGLCFVDYTCAAPYLAIDMHPKKAGQSLDAIYFSPHKFLGGPGTPGVLVFSSNLYRNAVPDRPGGGTVLWTNPWGGRRYSDDIETREDGGTPPFLGVIKAAMAIRLKEQMGLAKLATREHQIVTTLFQELSGVPHLAILDHDRTNRLALFAFTIDGLHYNLVTRLLSDHYGIQVRGGCACAGTYGHCLLNIERERSKFITDKVDRGDLSDRPGFVRVSLHPITDDQTIKIIASAIRDIADHGAAMAKDYDYDSSTNEYRHRDYAPVSPEADIFQT